MESTFMLIGYARTSTFEQEAGLQAQERDLQAAGVERIFREQTSATGPRNALAEAIDFAREGDVLVVTKLDRLARSVADLVTITQTLKRKKVGLRVLAMNLDTTTSTGRLMLNLLGSIAEFERDLMLERQKEGIAKAKAEGKYRGRAPTVRRQAERIRQLKAQGLSAKAVAEQLGISQRSVFRILSS
jgi:DNA invertase Pin-like site-specific DNA recombinase